MHTPLSADIRGELRQGTPVTAAMPQISAQPGPGVNAAHSRDRFVGLDLVDTISGGAGRFHESGHVTVDEIEIREHPLVSD